MFKRGAFVKWHVSLCIFQETTELLIKCRRKQSLSLYVKSDCFCLSKTIFWFNLYSFSIFSHRLIFPNLLKFICDFLALMKSILKAGWCHGKADGCLLIPMFRWIRLHFHHIVCVYPQSKYLSQIIIYIKKNCVFPGNPKHWNAILLG